MTFVSSLKLQQNPGSIAMNLPSKAEQYLVTLGDLEIFAILIFLY